MRCLPSLLSRDKMAIRFGSVPQVAKNLYKQWIPRFQGLFMRPGKAWSIDSVARQLVGLYACS